MTLSGGNVASIRYSSLNDIFNGRAVAGGVMAGDVLASATENFSDLYNHGYLVTADCFLNAQLSALENDALTEIWQLQISSSSTPWKTVC